MDRLHHPGYDVARKILTVPRLLTARRSVKVESTNVTLVQRRVTFFLARISSAQKAKISE